MNKRLVVISGPSGVGKGPIIEWTKKQYFPDLCQVNCLMITLSVSAAQKGAYETPKKNSTTH